MADAAPDTPPVVAELEYYKRKCDELGAVHLKLDYLVSRLRFELQQRREGFALIAGLQRSMGGSTDLLELYDVATAAINTTLRMDRTVFLAAGEHQCYVPVRWRGFTDDEIARIPPLRFADAAQGGALDGALIVNKATPVTSFIDALRASFAIPYFVLLPVRAEGGLLGLLLTGRLLEATGLSSFSPPLSSSDADTLQAIAGLISALVQSRQLTELRAESELKELELEKARELEKAYELLKATQAQLVQQEKLASLGALTAGIAHEIKNPLNFVNNFAQLSVELLDELEEEIAGDAELPAAALAGALADLKANAGKIAEHGRRADGIVRSMMEHASADSGRKMRTDVNALSHQYVALAYHSLLARIPDAVVRIDERYDGQLPDADLLPKEIGQVFVNILSNAFDAVLEKQASSDAQYEPTIVVSTCLRDELVEIRVEDNGPGIAPQLQQKIFEPFFTTKPAGKGTGLGLSLGYDVVVRTCGGTFTVESEMGQGAAFVLRFPRSAEYAGSE